MASSIPFRRFPALALLTAASAFATLERVATACKPPRFTPTEIAPRDGESMPASAPGILVRGEADLDLKLFAADGAAVAGTSKTSGAYRYFAPDAPLIPGAYTFRYPVYGSDGGTVATDATIRVTDAAPVPSFAGALDVAEKGSGTLSVATSSGSCTEQVDAAFVRLTLRPSDELVPYQHVLAWETTVDGTPWASAVGTLSTDNAARSVLNVFTACAPEADGRDNGLSPGQHTVSVQPVLVGDTGAPIAPATLRVWVTCGPENGLPAVSDDWSANGGGVDHDPEAPSSGDFTRTSSGCAIGAWATRGSVPAAALVLALAATSARRRRRR